MGRLANTVFVGVSSMLWLCGGLFTVGYIGHFDNGLALVATVIAWPLFLGGAVAGRVM